MLLLYLLRSRDLQRWRKTLNSTQILLGTKTESVELQETKSMYKPEYLFSERTSPNKLKYCKHDKMQKKNIFLFIN